MARFRLELGPVPLHHQVYLDLRAALDAGEWRPGDLLPPERQLAARYGCSLITVRRALSELTHEGRLERRRGHGTTVLRQRIERDFGGTMSFAEEMQDRGLDPETRLVAARPESAGERVAAALGILPGSPTLYVERLRVAGGEPLLLEQVHLPAERFPGLLASDLEHGSLYDLLTLRYGTRVARARESLEPVLLHTREAGLLSQPPRAPALLIEGIAYAPRASPSSSPGRTSAAIAPATTSSASWSARAGRENRRPTSVDSDHPGGRPQTAAGPTFQAPAEGRRGNRLTEPSDQGGGASWHRVCPVPAVFVAIFALIVGACGGSTTSPRRRARGEHAPRGAVAAASQSGRHVAATTAGAPVEIRWFCCLGGGERPSQQKRSRTGRRRLQRLHPNINASIVTTRHTRRPRRLRTRIASGKPPDVVGRSASAARTRSRASGSTSRRTSRRTTSTCRLRPGVVEPLQVRRQGQLGIPFAIYPSELYYQPDMFDAAGLNPPPPTTASSTRCPTTRWSTGTTTPSATSRCS
jgi:GntR family transcriptional regulator